MANGEECCWSAGHGEGVRVSHKIIDVPLSRPQAVITHIVDLWATLSCNDNWVLSRSAATTTRSIAMPEDTASGYSDVVGSIMEIKQTVSGNCRHETASNSKTNQPQGARSRALWAPHCNSSQIQQKLMNCAQAMHWLVICEIYSQGGQATIANHTTWCLCV